jgi:hypothetical protein
MKFSVLEIILILIVAQYSISMLATKNDLRLCTNQNRILNVEMPRSK